MKLNITNKLNKNGTKGVYFIQNRNKWHACISYKNKIYNLGRFENQEDAVEIRKTAEKMIGENFEDWYQEYKKEKKLDRKLDIPIGAVFGRLKVIKETGIKNKQGLYLWECQCECGNVKNVPGSRLVKGYITNCGCSRLNRKKNYPTNKNGTKGVYLSQNKWHACIGYKKKNYHLGRFENKENAVEIRKTAEKMIGEKFEDWYKEYRKKKGTNYIRLSKLSKSGTQGVYLIQNKWYARISYKNKIYHLGCFENKEDAVEIRKTAEKMIGENFEDWYKEYREKKGTNYIRLSKLSKSGTQGVYLIQNKWYARISYKNKIYHLGCFENKEDAVEIRKTAEKMIGENFEDWYQEYRKEKKIDGRLDIPIGAVFGRLKVIEETRTKDKHGNYLWECQCECGNIKNISGSSLRRGYIKSCGCLRLNRKKNYPTNKSGTQGVCFKKKDQKWYAYITYKKKNYHLGYFENQEDAVEIRKTAEKMIGENFEDWYKVIKNKTAPK